jgi:acyl-coenzyme A synthetase/AMP-(fatty) acid ligase
MNATTLNDYAAARLRLQSDPGIGMGNFLWKALTVFPEDFGTIISPRPLETAWGEQGQVFNLGDLARLAEAYARRYAALGVGRQDPVGVYVDHGLKYLLHFLALTRLGAIPVLVNSRMDPVIADRHLRRVGVVGVYTDEVRRTALQASEHAAFGFTIVESDFRDAPTREPVPYIHHEHDAVLVTHSSGTTGFPKAVLLQHGGFFYPVARSLDRPLDPATNGPLIALPPSHNAAISAVAMALLNGGEFILMSDQDGKSVIAAIEHYRPTAVVAFPQTLVDVIASHPEAHDLSSVGLWFNLGDAAHERHIKQLVRFGHHQRGRSSREGSRFIDGLGSSEMGVTLFTIDHSADTRHYNRCVGRPQPWVEAAILDANGARLPDGEPGLLAVKSRSVSNGYWNDSNLTFKSRLNGYFLTGDIAYRDEFGLFYHLDRATDLLKTDRGTIHTLVYEETLLNAIDALLDCTVVAFEVRPGEPCAVCLAILREGQQVDERALHNEIDAVLTARGLRPIDEVRIIPMSELAVGVTGKVLKAHLRRVLQRELAERPETARTSRAAVSSGAVN